MKITTAKMKANVTLEDVGKNRVWLINKIKSAKGITVKEIQMGDKESITIKISL